MNKPIDVFLDPEAVGVGNLPFGEGARAGVLLERLPGFLDGIGYVIRNLWERRAYAGRGEICPVAFSALCGTYCPKTAARCTGATR